MHNRTLFLKILILFATIIYSGCTNQAAKQASSSNAIESSGEEAPIQIKQVNPEYPAAALRDGIAGTVWVKIRVDTLGVVKEAVIAKDSGKNVGFEDAAITAALKTKWKPAKSNGKPFETWITFKVDFNIK